MSEPVELIIPRMDFRQAIAEGVHIDYPDGQKFAKYFTKLGNPKYRAHLKKWEMMMLELPYKDKDDAKKISHQEGDAGLRWNPQYRHWVIPRQASKLFEKWNPLPLTGASEMPVEDDEDPLDDA